MPDPQASSLVLPAHAALLQNVHISCLHVWYCQCCSLRLHLTVIHQCRPMDRRRPVAYMALVELASSLNAADDKRLMIPVLCIHAHRCQSVRGSSCCMGTHATSLYTQTHHTGPSYIHRYCSLLPIDRPFFLFEPPDRILLWKRKEAARCMNQEI